MERDPKKRITGVGTGIHKGEIRVILIVNGLEPLVILSTGLDLRQAELVLSGYADGLQGSTDLTTDMITAFLNDPWAVEALQVPLDHEVEPADRELFKRAALGGLKL